MLEAVLFDFNGVLVDDEHLHHAAFNEVLAPHGVRMSDEDYAERYLGFDDRGAFRAVFADHGREADEALVQALIREKSGAYARRAEKELRIFPGAAALVRACAERVPVAIVSGALRGEIEPALDAMGVRSLVRFIVAAEDVKACKPNPEGYTKALALLRDGPPEATGRFPAKRVVVVEDSTAGVVSGLVAGMPVAAVAHSYAAGVLEAAGASLVRERIAELTLKDLTSLATG